jgi:CMP-N,N'-diacetyllegionaminic acid synthase
MRVLGIIPARGGSKGVSGKNIRLIDKKPLIAYTIEKAKNSNLLTDVIVSTDCEKIIEVVKGFDCRYLKRSSENAQDHSTIESVIFEVLASITSKYDLIILLQPTAPIREVEDIDNVIKMFINDINLKCVVSVIELEDIHPARMYHVDHNYLMSPLNEELERKRRQDLQPVCIRNGSIYAIRTPVFYENKKLILDEKKAYIMPESKWANVDTERDLLITELLVKQWKKGNL